MAIEVPLRLRSVFDEDRQCVEAAQKKNKTPKGRFIQQFRVHSAVGGPDGRPEKEAVALTAEAKLDSKATYERQIDQYVGPRGNGYVVTYFWTEGGKDYAASYNHGPETWRNCPPHEVVEPELPKV